MSNEIKVESREIYITSDGNEFNDAKSAEQHQASLSHADGIEKFLAEQMASKTLKYRLTLKHILMQWEAFKATM